MEDVCIGCGTCVFGCSRLVYHFDFDRKKPVVFDPLNCMVGCIICANTCPANAIVFPSLDSVLALESRAEVRHAIEDDLLARRDVLASSSDQKVPHQYIELWQLGSDYLSRSYSIANAPHGDRRIELHLRQVAGGRFSDWAFDEMQVGDRVRARGPLGACCAAPVCGGRHRVCADSCAF